jgi:uncharacterized membrane protein YkoI
MASIPTYDIKFQQGDTEKFEFKRKTKDLNGALVNAYDLTGAEIRMQARASASDKTAVLDLSSQSITGDNIEFDVADCRVTVNVSDATMASIKPGDYVYDIECTFADGKKKKLVKGSLSVEAEVTK